MANRKDQKPYVSIREYKEESGVKQTRTITNLREFGLKFFRLGRDLCFYRDDFEQATRAKAEHDEQMYRDRLRARRKQGGKKPVGAGR